MWFSPCTNRRPPHGNKAGANSRRLSWVPCAVCFLPALSLDTMASTVSTRPCKASDSSSQTRLPHVTALTLRWRAKRRQEHCHRRAFYLFTSHNLFGDLLFFAIGPAPSDATNNRRGRFTLSGAVIVLGSIWPAVCKLCPTMALSRSLHGPLPPNNILTQYLAHLHELFLCRTSWTTPTQRSCTYNAISLLCIHLETPAKRT